MSKLHDSVGKVNALVRSGFKLHSFIRLTWYFNDIYAKFHLRNDKLLAQMVTLRKILLKAIMN